MPVLVHILVRVVIFSIAEHIKKLHDRQIHLSQLRVNAENKRRQMRQHYKSTFVGNLAVIDQEAILKLANFSYNKFKNQLKKHLKLDLEEEDEGSFYQVYHPKFDKHDRENVPIINKLN